MEEGRVTLLSSGTNILIYKFKGTGHRGVRRLAGTDPSPLTGNKIWKCVQPYISYICRISFKYTKKNVIYKLLHK